MTTLTILSAYLLLSIAFATLAGKFIKAGGGQ